MCPDKAGFVAAILDRAPEAREVTPTSASFSFVAHLEASGALARGYVVVQQQDGSTSRRDVADAPCSEVVESMAVILSLILAGSESSPSAGEPAPPLAPVPPPATAPTSGAPPPPAAESAPVEPAPAAAPSPPAPPPPARRTAAAQPREPTTTAAAERDAPPDSERLRFGVLVSVLAQTGVAPSIALGGQGGLDIWWARNRYWSPSARLTGRYVRSGLETTDDGNNGSARFRLAALRAELCPVRWPARSRAFGRVCAIVDAGQLEANPQDVPEGEVQRQTMPWFGGGGSLRLEAELADFIAFEAAADLVALGRSDRFTFEPGSHTLHQVPRVSAMFSLGAVLRLP
jgi:hypothetical protein